MLLLTALVSLAPVVGLKRLGIAASTRQAAAQATLAQRIAGTAQITIAGTLGGAATAFAWYLASLTFGDPGYAMQNRYATHFSPDTPNRRPEESRQDYFEGRFVESARRREAILAIPGVRDVTFGNPVPGFGGLSWAESAHPDNPQERTTVTIGSIDDRYVDVLDLRVLHGRAPNETDLDVVLVNQALAQAPWGRDDVVGELAPSELLFFGQPGRGEIIGVLEDLSFLHPSADVEPTVFTVNGSGSFSDWAIIESALTAAELQRELERISEAVEVEFTVDIVQPLAMRRSELIAPDRARSLLTIGAAALVVLLAAFGFYGTQSYLVTAGRREYAIRASIGAGPNALGRLVYRRGLGLSLPGLAAGGLFAFIAVAWLRDEYVSQEISPGAVTAAVVLGLAMLLLLASLGPARHARRTPPAPLLREE